MDKTNTCDKCKQSFDSEDLVWISSEDFEPKGNEEVPYSVLKKYDTLCESCYLEEIIIQKEGSKMEHNYHSSANQGVLRKLVEREVLCNQNCLVTRIIREFHDDFEFEIINEFAGHSEAIEELEEIRDEMVNNISELEERIEGIEEDIEEAKSRGERGENDKAIQEKLKEKYESLLEGYEDELRYIESDIEELEAEQEEPAEVLEWWLVTPYFAEKLREKGEAFLSFEGEEWWGRTCSGQAIFLDGVIGEIGRDMEILEGQPNHRFWRN